MPVSKIIAEQMGHASWIRRMFVEGARLKRERGAENVFDYSLGNPDIEPPDAVLKTLQRIACNPKPGAHGYMPNAGHPQLRKALAAELARETGVPFTPEDVFLTVGAAGASNVILKAILNPGDEVIALRPFFAEYPFYIGNHGGRAVEVETTADFLPDVPRIADAITPRTRAIILNTPNNPTGRVYPESVLRELDAVLRRAPQPIIVISDEPYTSIVFDGKKAPAVAACMANTVICGSWSKSLAIPGERIGYLALSPDLPDLADLRRAVTFCNRTLGFVNAPAIWQWVLMENVNIKADMSCYEERRNFLCDELVNAGYELLRPEGTFYLFPKTPIPDDVAFIQTLAAEGVLAVPGVGFGRSGYMRLSLTIPMEQIKKSVRGFERALAAVRRG
jgi:aspartate aminotransferase